MCRPCSRSRSLKKPIVRTRSSMSNGVTYWVSMMPTDRPDDPAAGCSASRTVTSVTPRRARCSAVARPTAPPPTMQTEGLVMVVGLLLVDGLEGVGDCVDGVLVHRGREAEQAV